jgi:DNA-binding MarR family transcriptional regulator
MEPLKDARSSWKRIYPGSDEFAAAVAILDAERIVAARMIAIFGKHSVTMADWSVMTTLKFAETEELPLGKIADVLDVHATTVTNAVDRLEKRGWVRRDPHAIDRRTIRAVLTDKGSKHLAEVQKALADAKFGLTALSATERRDLAALLIKIIGDYRETTGIVRPTSKKPRAAGENRGRISARILLE